MTQRGMAAPHAHPKQITNRTYVGIAGAVKKHRAYTLELQTPEIASNDTQARFHNP